MNLTPFATALTDAMTEAEVEAKELARRTGLGLSTVYAYRSGLREPSVGNARLIARKLVDIKPATRNRLLSAAKAEEPDDLPALAADLVSALPGKQRELAVALLRTQVELSRPRRTKETQDATAKTRAGSARSIEQIEADTKARIDAVIDAEGAPRPLMGR